MKSSFLIGLDIGTSSVKAVVVERKDGKPLLRGIVREEAGGIRKGVIVDLADASSAVAKALFAAKKIAGAGLKAVYVNVGSSQSKSQRSHGIVAVSRADSEIYQDDVDRVIRASQAVSVAPNRMILHNVTCEYIVDGVGDIVDPLGLSGNRLEVASLVIDTFAPHVKSVVRVVELAGGKVAGLVFDPLLASRSALTKNQKDIGVAVLDIGHGTTGMAAYEENKLIGTAVFPLGAGNITNDIAIGLKIPVEVAEKIKLNYGYALSREVNPRESVELQKFMPDAKGSISRRFVSEIVESRLAEIFDFVNNELKVWGRAGQLAGGVVLTGGGAKLPGITGLAKTSLKFSSQIGLALSDEWAPGSAEEFPDAFEDPEYVSTLGLALWGAERERWQGAGKFNFKSLVRYLLP